MSKAVTCGMLLYRRTNQLEVLLVHPGGDHNKDIDVWSIPKGISDPTDSTFKAAALREFHEETGIELDPTDKYSCLGINNSYSKKKRMIAFSLNKDVDVSNCVSNTCEYPPNSGIIIPEVDAYRWFSYMEADSKIHPNQRQFLYELANQLYKESAY